MISIGRVGDCGIGRVVLMDGLEGEPGWEPAAFRAPILTVMGAGRVCVKMC